MSIKGEIPPIGGMPAGEVWMSTHRRAPSKVLLAEAETGLDALIEQDPAFWLGPEAAREFGDLPFLFKVLAAGAPLSLQVHPDRTAAQTGHAEEEARGIPLLAPERTFKDPNHKPELAVALTPFSAMAGFRPIEEIKSLLGPELCALAGVDSLPDGAEAFRELVRRLFNVPQEAREKRQSAIARRAGELSASSQTRERQAGRLVLELIERYPGDPGQCAPLVLDILELEPGQGLFIPAGVIHAYLKGSILEIMACSDNVVRAGLTVKHVDVDLLCRILDPEAKPLCINAEPAGDDAPGMRHLVWHTPTREFRLERFVLEGEESRASQACWKPEGPEILLCTRGEAQIHADSSYALRARSSLFIAGTCPRLTLQGRAEVWRAAVGFEQSASKSPEKGPAP
jgi:mannose-6-phosphate isomerase